MSSASSAVTYTSVYTDSEPGRVFWGADEELSDGDYIPVPEEPQTPPAPQDKDEHEPMFIQPHDPDFVPEPIYPEYIPLEDEYILSAEEQPLPPVVSCTAESPRYVAELDPEEYEDDETKDEPVIPPPSNDTATTEARIAVRLQAAIFFPPEAKVERLLAMTTPSPSPITSLSPPSVDILPNSLNEERKLIDLPSSNPYTTIHSSLSLLNKNKTPIDHLDLIHEEHRRHVATRSFGGPKSTLATILDVPLFTILIDNEEGLMIRKYFIAYAKTNVSLFHDKLLEHIESLRESILERAKHKREKDRRVNDRIMQLKERNGNSSKALDVGLVVTKSNETDLERHVLSSRFGKDTHIDDADINSVNDK
nr:hypothetical protein [Tanacetum cinerariifolium]